MTKYAAFLRGIGPGNPNMTKEKFQHFFSELGFMNIQVILASGNIVFEGHDVSPTDINERIETALPRILGFKRSVFIRSQSELEKLIEDDPFHGIEQNHNKQSYLLITFFKQLPYISFPFPYTPEGKPYTLLGRTDNTIYGVVDLTRCKTPEYMAWLEKRFGKELTSRTPGTIRIILSRMHGGIASGN